jgi:hypothetical protein
MRSPCSLSVSVFCRSITFHIPLFNIVLLSVPDHGLFFSADVTAGHPGLKGKVHFFYPLSLL